MPISGIEQPAVLPIDDGLRLRKFDGSFDFALEWYQDTETVWLVDGVKAPYTPEKLERMYRYLDKHGELYWIEVLDGSWKPIGDVAFWREDMPIVIGDKTYRGQRIGQRVVRALAARGRALGYSELYVNEIYAYNTGSRTCFEHAGFQAYEQSEKGSRFVLEL